MAKILSNSSVNLLSQATPAKVLSILEVMDCDSGEILNVREFISSHRYQDIFAPRQECRTRWKTKNPKFICPFCLIPVSLLGRLEKHWFFRHLYEDGTCTAKTRGKFNQDQIKAAKYHAQRESQAHIHFKENLARCIKADERFQPPIVEGRWNATEGNKKWRKPDVRSGFNKIDLAFEVQLSTTFLDVVLERRAFYQQEKAGLIWILPHFEPESHRMMEDDILCSNNKNVLVLDNETTEISLLRGAVHFRCWYRKPFEAALKIEADWVSEIVDFSNIIIDIEKQSVYYFDYDAAENLEKLKIAEKIRDANERAQEAVRQRQQEKDDSVRDGFERAWLTLSNHKLSEPMDQDELDWLTNQCSARQIELPLRQSCPQDITALLNGIYSAKLGHSVGWNFADLVKVGHHLADQYPALLPLFGFACKAFGTIELLKKQDSTGKFGGKISAINTLDSQSRKQFLPIGYAKELCDFLFPEIAEKLMKWASSDISASEFREHVT